jgi:hypothetical protein
MESIVCNCAAARHRRHLFRSVIACAVLWNAWLHRVETLLVVAVVGLAAPRP